MIVQRKILAVQDEKQEQLSQRSGGRQVSIGITQLPVEGECRNRENRPIAGLGEISKIFLCMLCVDCCE
jgi:hypothetical protein